MQTAINWRVRNKQVRNIKYMVNVSRFEIGKDTFQNLTKE